MFYTKFLAKYNGHQEALGSDSVLILDGRFSLKNMIKKSYAQMHRLRFVQPNYVGFNIYRSNEGRYTGGHKIYTTEVPNG